MAAARDPGLQAERTELAWWRTSLGVAVIALLVFRAGLVADDVPLIAGGVLLAAMSGIAIVAGRIRRRELAAESPRAPSSRMLFLVSATIVFAACCSVWALR